MATRLKNRIAFRVVKMDMNQFCASQVNGQLKSLINEVTSDQDIVLDMERVEKIDSAGLAALVSLLDAVEKTGHRLRIANMQSRVRTVAGLVRLHKVIEIYHSVDFAIHSLLTR